MANINAGGGDKKKSQPEQKTLRVDFTPMVDMNMLLITFFMFATTMQKPKTMELVLPTKDTETLSDEDRSKVKDTHSITIILGENDVAYYYFGKPNYEDWTSLKETDYSPEGLRQMLVERNRIPILNMKALNIQRARKQVSEEQYNEQAKEIRNDKVNGQTVIIKPTKGSNFKNLVDVLDEMHICSIGTYAIVDMTEGDDFLVQNFMEKGALTAKAADIAK